jgi:hypothetical protein
LVAAACSVRTLPSSGRLYTSVYNSDMYNMLQK